MMKHLDAAEGIGDKFPSKFRYDIASGDWVVIASGRSKRPETFKGKDREISDPDDCPFCGDEAYRYLTHLIKDGKEIENPESLEEGWSVAAIPNKFPAFIPEGELREERKGPYVRMNAVGFHEVIITEDHRKSIGKMEVGQVEEIFKTYRSRFLKLKDEPNVNYISIFHNHGKGAGASIDHPHSQLITTPLVDVDVKNSLEVAADYMDEKESCLYCDMQDWEMEEGERIVYENDQFLVICPYASKVAFQTVITPKKHRSRFEDISDEGLRLLADAFQKALSKIYKGVGNPDYNFYLHTAPCDGEDYDFYHWHWTIMPRTSAFAGFEFGAGMEISTIKPEIAAKHLKEI